MTNEQLKDIFGRFDNLNLVTLIGNLEEGRVIRYHWRQGSFMCPLWHQLGGSAEAGSLLGNSSSGGSFAQAAGLVDEETATSFISWWDSRENKQGRLLETVREIFDERLQDADAVQSVLEGQLCSLAI